MENVPEKYLFKLIKSTVESNTREFVPHDAAFNISSYLSNLRTRNIVYRKMIERVDYYKLEDYNKVLLRVLCLFKKYLFEFVPDANMLKEIENFFRRVQRSEDEVIGNELFYLRNIVSSLLSHSSDGKIRKSKKRKIKKSRRGKKKSEKEYHFVKNVLSFRCRGVDPKINIFSFESKSDFLIIREMTNKRVEMISLYKKMEEQSRFNTIRRTRPLFQFKYYKDQEKLVVEDEILDKIISTAISATDNENFLVASKILIKILIDLYCDDIKIASGIVMSILIEMLESESMISKINALNLLFNLSVHVMLLEEIPLHDPDADASTPFITTIQDELFGLLLYVLRSLFYDNESRNNVWGTALNSILYFITHNGEILMGKLKEIDVEIILSLYKYIIYIPDSVLTYLMRILVNKLYLDDDCKYVDLSAIEKCGGINIIIDIYLDTRILEVEDSLFAIIFDYCVFGMDNDFSERATADDIEEILFFLRDIEASHSLRKFFQNQSKPSGESISDLLRSLFLIQNQNILDLIIKNYNFNNDVLLELLSFMYELRDNYFFMEEELQVVYDRAVNDGDYQELILVLDALIYSEITLDFKQGIILLYHIYQHSLRDPSILELNPTFDQILQSLLSLNQFWKKKNFFSIIAQRSSFIDKKKNPLAVSNLINEYYNYIIQLEESSEPVLIYAFDILFIITSEFLDYHDLEKNNCIYDLFLEGTIGINFDIVETVMIEIFEYLFIHIPSRHSSKIKHVILNIIVEKCYRNRNDLEKIGGTSFFKKLLDTNDPHLTLISSRFLLKILQQEKPSQFNSIINTLLERAVEINDENLIANPYLQIKTILEMQAN